MFHPFLILPMIGVTMLLKVALSYSQSPVILILFCVIAVFCITFYIMEINHVPFGQALRPNYRHHAGYRIDLQHMGLDRAELFFDVINIPLPNLNIVQATKTDVHDHAIQQSIVCGIKALKSWYREVYGDAIIDRALLENVKEYIFNGYDGSYKKKEEAYSTLKSIIRINGFVNSIDMRESDVLLLVWSRIMDPINKDVAEELKSNLVESMADGTIAVDSPYCLTGRVTRIVQSLESIDKGNIVNIKSTECVKDEISLRVAQLRTDFFKKHPSLETIYNADKDDAPTQLVNKDLKSYINDNLHKEYVLSNIVTDTTYKNITAPLIDAL